MAFSFGGSKTQSQSSSLDYSNSTSNSSSLSTGTSQSTSGGQSSSKQTVAFEDLLRQLYGGATDAAMASVADAPLFKQESEQLFTGGLGFLDQLQNVPGSEYLAGRVTGPDAAAEAQIGVLGDSLSKFFDERLMPAITSRGVSTGTLGGSRNSVSIGKAAGEVSSAYSSGVASILSSSQAARDAAAAALGSNSVNAAGVGLGALPSLAGLSEAGLNAGLSPYLALSKILGGPTVLGESSSTQSSQSSSEDMATAISEAIAMSFGTSQSTSKGKSFNFGFSPGSVVS